MLVSTHPKTEEDPKNILEQKIKNIPDYSYLEIEKGNYQYVYVKKSDFEYVSDFLGFLVYKNKQHFYYGTIVIFYYEFLFLLLFFQ